MLRMQGHWHVADGDLLVEQVLGLHQLLGQIVEPALAVVDVALDVPVLLNLLIEGLLSHLQAAARSSVAYVSRDDGGQPRMMTVVSPAYRAASEPRISNSLSGCEPSVVTRWLSCCC